MTTEAATPDEEILDPDSQEPVDEPTEDEGLPEDELAAEPESDVPAEAESAEPPEEPEAEAADEGPDAEEEPALPEAETPETEAEREPFSFRVDGTSVDVDGAYVEDGRIVMPKEAWHETIHNYVADRRQIQTREQQYKRQIERLRESQGNKEQRAEILLNKVDELLSDPEALAAFYENYEQNAERLRLEVENELLKAREGRATERVQEYDRREQMEQFEEVARPGLRQGVEHVLTEDEFSGLDLEPDELSEHIWSLWEQGAPVFFQATEGDGSGLQPGEAGVNLNLIRQTLRPTAKLHQKTAAERKAEQVKQKNRQAVEKKKEPPPTAGAKGSPAPSSEPKRPETEDEWREHKRNLYKRLNLPVP